MCDYEKGGDSTAAIALQQLNTGGIVYHVAWNKCSKTEADRGIEFLGRVLTMLRSTSTATREENEMIEKEIFELVIKHSKKRNSYYASSLAKDLKFVLEHWNDQNDQNPGRCSVLHTCLCSSIRSV